MRAVVHNKWRTEIFLTEEEFKKYCKPGCGSDTCVWAVVGRKHGFECTFLNKPRILEKRWREGDTVAKRDGCIKVKMFNPKKAGLGTTDF